MLQLVVGESTLTLMRGDITQVEAGAIVNAANSSLMGGGGVDGAIHRVGGGSIQAECRSIVAATGRLQPGHAVATTAGRLHARHVIHTVGPVWQDGSHDEADVLASCYREALRLAQEDARLKGITDIAPVRGGRMANALSLGAFPSLEKARSHAAALSAKGLRGVRFGPRPEAGEVRLLFSSGAGGGLPEIPADTWPAGLKPGACEAGG